ncbi:hypothetical protein RIF29_18010 [Crotalaria pallida]|uniref:Uncharacterized protein n=1 Tax=Crotalaria pallida TaxID=3830 RepID=A0AAN9IFU0_CROPI
MIMNKFKISQILRPTYLSFIFNLLIITLGAEADLLSAFEDRKQPPASVNLKATMPSEVIISEKREASAISEHDEKKKPKVVEKFETDKIVGGGEADEEVMDGELVEEDEIGGVNGQELFAKAEAFIGNFYKQLKMQREDSSILTSCSSALLRSHCLQSVLTPCSSILTSCSSVLTVSCSSVLTSCSSVLTSAQSRFSFFSLLLSFVLTCHRPSQLNKILLHPHCSISALITHLPQSSSIPKNSNPNPNNQCTS